MSAFLAWVIAAAILGLTCLVLFIVAISNKRFSAFYTSFASLLLAVICAVIAAYTFADRSFHRLREMLAPRDGLEIYTALFGPPAGCVNVIDAQDQVIPKLDSAIRLHMNVCPVEIKRIIDKDVYAMAYLVTGTAPKAIGPDPFPPVLLGDTVLEYSTVIEPGRNWRTIFVKRDSTEAIIIDTLD